MAKQQTISLNSNQLLLRIFASSLVSVIVLMYLALSQGVFAEQSENPFPKVITDVPEEELIKRLLTDVPNVAVGKNNNDDSWKSVRMRVTAYCPCSVCCGEYSDGITADNHEIRDGDRFVAADKMYSFGTEMIITGYNDTEPVKVKDRGGAIQGDKLDVFFNTHQEALQWGVQHVYVLIKTQ